MTIYEESWVRGYEATRDRLARDGMYLPEEEHASCGVGLVAAIDGKPRRDVVEHGIAALKAVWHRGAVDADGKTGDGAGIHVQIPIAFFWDQIARYRSSDWAERAFCKTCGTGLFYRVIGTDVHYMSLGLFDDQERWQMASQIFTDEKPGYYDFANETEMMTGAEVFAAVATAEAAAEKDT